MFSRTPIAAALLFALAATGCSEPAPSKDAAAQPAAAQATSTTAVTAENPLLKPSSIKSKMSTICRLLHKA